MSALYEPSPADLATIVAYVDGELSEEERMHFEVRLSEEPELFAALESFSRLDHLQWAARAGGDASDRTGGRQLTGWAVLAAAMAVLLVVALRSWGPRAEESFGLRVAVASDPGALGGTRRGADEGDAFYLSCLVSRAGALRLFSIDEQGEVRALVLDADGNSSLEVRPGAATDELETLGPFRSGWLDGEGVERRHVHFLLLVTGLAVGDGRVTRFLEELMEDPGSTDPSRSSARRLGTQLAEHFDGEVRVVEIATGLRLR